MDPEWRTCTDLEAMLEALKEASPRKLRLFAVACCRQFEYRIPHVRGDAGLDVVERYADGQASGRELATARRNMRTASFDDALNAVINANSSSAWGAAIAAAGSAARAIAWASVGASAMSDIDAAIRAESVAQCDLLREVFGNPFRPLPPRPDAIAPLAQEIYVGKWDLMPLLGEWLQEHGNWDIGERCLDPALKHYKGCWVVDWVLGKQ